MTNAVEIDATPSPSTDLPREIPGQDLKAKSVRGGAATVVGQGIQLVVQITAAAVLARLLDPVDFGLVAMVATVTRFVAVLQDGGLSSATVQRKTIDHEQISTLFWCNVVIGAVLTLFVVAVASPTAWFYGDARLTWITIASSLPLFVGGFSVQHMALLRREMRFGTIALVGLAAQLVGVVVAIVLAFWGVGYWSLVFMGVANTLSVTALSWTCCRWRPGRPRRGAGVRPMLFFGGNLTGSQLLSRCSRTLDNVLIGWVWGPQVLGVYTRAYTLLTMPIRQINGPMTMVAVPALSSLQNDRSRFRQFYVQAMTLVAMVALPLVAYCFVFADDLVLILLGPKWPAVVPIFRALAPAAFIGSLNVANSWVLIPLGRADRMLHCSLFGSTCITISFFIGVSWGPVGVAVALSIASALVRPIQLWYSFRGTPVSLRDVGSVIWRPAVAAVFAGIVAMAIVSRTDITHPVPSLLSGTAVFGMAHLGSLLWIPGGRRALATLTGAIRQLRACN